MNRDERWRVGSYDEGPMSILGASVRALEVLGKQVNEETLFEAVKDRGIKRSQVKDFLAKAERGKRHRRSQRDKEWPG